MGVRNAIVPRAPSEREVRVAARPASRARCPSAQSLLCDALKRGERFSIEKHKINLLERRRAFEMTHDFINHDLRALAKRKSGNPGPDRGKRNRFEFLVGGEP